MEKKIKLSEEKRVQQMKDFELKEVQKRVNNGAIPKNPTRLFKVGDGVKIGNLQNITVTEVLFEGLAYAVHYDYMGTSYGKPDRKTGSGIWEWTDVFPVNCFGKGVPMREEDDIQIRYFNNDISSLLSKAYNGVDFNPSYQRDLVWTMKQKLELLDSIFTNVDIGKFTFIKHDFDGEREFYYEILDGKQRLSTICEFYEDRFAWRGKKYSELCFPDAIHFTRFPIIQGEVGEMSEQQIYKLFVRMNTSGTPVSKEHLNKIKSLIIE